MSGDKTHLGIVIVGHVDAGKSTTTGRLLFELGGMSDRDLAKLKKEAAELGKESFLFAFFMDKSKEERARGVTINCVAREFFTDSYHYTIIDAPGHRFVLSTIFIILLFNYSSFTSSANKSQIKHKILLNPPPPKINQNQA